MGLSVIVPVAENDESWRELLPDLVDLTIDDEILFVSPKERRSEIEVLIQKQPFTTRVRWIVYGGGRAKQLNFGAANATYDWLWFLHCDSRVTDFAIAKLKSQIMNMQARGLATVFYFNLSFLHDGPSLLILNQVGTWFRSHVLRLPFGDQGFCLAKTIFNDLGRFDESTPFGEDHLLIWKAHQNQVSLQCIGASLKTSGRKYRDHGWLNTTTSHLKFTLLQAAPELIRLFKPKGHL